MEEELENGDLWERLLQRRKRKMMKDIMQIMMNRPRIRPMKPLWFCG